MALEVLPAAVSGAVLLIISLAVEVNGEKFLWAGSPVFLRSHTSYRDLMEQLCSWPVLSLRSSLILDESLCTAPSTNLTLCLSLPAWLSYVRLNPIVGVER